MIRLSSPIKWHGGKFYMANLIHGLMPRHMHYVEPFAGSLAVLFRRDPNDKTLWLDPEKGVSELVNDLNGDLTNFWRVLRDEQKFERFKRIIEAVPFSQPEFEDAQEQLLLTTDKVEKAVCFFILARQSRAGSLKNFTPITRNRTRRLMNNEVSAWLNAVDKLPEVHKRLKRVLIFRKPAVEVVKSQDSEGTLFYLDPPYPKETRIATEAYGQFEMSDDDHLELLKTITKVKGKVIISTYPNKMYTEMLGDWHRHLTQMPNHVAAGVVKDIKFEALYMNFKPHRRDYD